jgi:phosphoglycerate dehydrogenase-like enzyme
MKTKILIPEGAVDGLTPDIHRLAPMNEIIPVTREGEVQGEIGDTEVVLLRWWGLPRKGFQRVVTETPNLRWIHTISAGVDHVLFPFLVDSDIVLTNASGAYDVPVAEMVLTYMLLVIKQIPEYFNQQAAHCWNRLRPKELRGLTVGIVGLGSIGREVARLTRTFGMRVVATRRHPERSAEVADLILPAERLDELLGQADFVVLAVPSTPETYHLIDAQALAQMKPDAWLINVARGMVVDETALLKALQGGCIGGACLDVFEKEPLPDDSLLWDLPNVIMTPHNSGVSIHLEKRAAELFLENLRCYMAGEPLLNVVDKKANYSTPPQVGNK